MDAAHVERHAYLSAKIFLVNEAFLAQEGEEVPDHGLSLIIRRVAHGGIHEDLDVTNYSQTPIRFNLELTLHSDFADLFEIKSKKFIRRACITTEWNSATRELRTSYAHRDFHREFRYRIASSDSAPDYTNGQLIFRIELKPGAVWHACCEYILVCREQVRTPAHVCPLDLDKTDAAKLHRRWIEGATALETSHEGLYRFYRQSIDDMGALRLHDHDMAEDVWVPAAGAPWFVTLFGRDSLIAGLQNMIVNPAFAERMPQKTSRVPRADRGAPRAVATVASRRT